MFETAGSTPKSNKPDLTELIARSAKSGNRDADRYGNQRGGMSRTRKILLGVVGLAILGAVVGYIGWEQANPPIQGTLISSVPTTNGVQITFEVDKAASMSATCVLAVEDYQGNVIGSATVQVPSGRAKSVQVYTVSVTESMASVSSALVQSCQGS
ncbi:MAG TPA: DUF4307 domain-containing protein [Actinocrinis sp.]|nr:DUF4307 domain-containing protein [Actinocrinis sp.]